MDFRSFMVDGIADEFHFEPEGGVGDGEEESPSNTFVNNEAPIIYVNPMNFAPPSHVAKNVGDLNDVSLEKGIVDEAERLRKSSKARGKRKQVTGPTVKEALHSDPDIYEFPSAMELKDFVDCHFVVAHAVLENMLNSWTRRLMSALQKQELLVMLSGKGKLRKTRPMISLRGNTLSILRSKLEELESKRERLKVSETQLLQDINKLRCTTFKEMATLKEPFTLEKMLGYRSASEKEFNQASDELAIASYPFITEAFANLYASLEELLLKKPRSHRSKFASSQSGPLSSKTLIN
ncbi:hypothetical protein Tco_0582059 [Tanacetum coccineum]